MSQTGGCRCGCGGHGKRNEQDERAAAPAVAQPVGEGYRPEPAQTSPEVVDAVAIASAVTTALGAGAPQGVTPGTRPVTCWACAMSPPPPRAVAVAAAEATDPAASHAVALEGLGDRRQA